MLLLFIHHCPVFLGVWGVCTCVCENSLDSYHAAPTLSPSFFLHLAMLPWFYKSKFKQISSAFRGKGTKYSMESRESIINFPYHGWGQSWHIKDQMRRKFRWADIHRTGFWNTVSRCICLRRCLIFNLWCTTNSSRDFLYVICFFHLLD